jgi:HD-like signal output (HDOD) protein/CheY-like chemotaxis protein
MNKRILFVDDEVNVLRGIQRGLRSMNKEWEIVFCTSGAEALEALSRSHFDVVITDMRMPGMDGAQLLEEVKIRFPRTVRMVLSGQSDRESILRSVGPTHQYLSKPCDAVELKQKLTRAFALRDLLENPQIKETVCRLETVPSPPDVYRLVMKELHATTGSTSRIGALIETDPGMSAKILQLANSAFFGLAHEVSSPAQAVSLIGIDNVRALVLAIHVFTQFPAESRTQLSALWKHSYQTAALARAISVFQDAPRTISDVSFTAALLHDIGRLILTSVYREQYANLMQKTGGHGPEAWTAEYETFGCTHAGVGAYLLGLWGLPNPIIEAVAWHHDPQNAVTNGFGPVAAVHVADHYDHKLQPDSIDQESTSIDEQFLEKSGLEDCLGPWWNVCKKLAAQEAAKENEHVRANLAGR